MLPPINQAPTAAQAAATQNAADYQRIFGSLPPTLAPSNAGQVNQVGQPIVPTGNATYGNPVPAYAATQGVQTNIDLGIKQQQEAAAAQAKAQADQLAQQGTQAKGYLSTLMSSNPATDARTNAQNQTGINPTNYFADQQSRITSIGELQKDYNATKASMEQAVAVAQQNDGGQLTGAVNSNVARIQKQYATQLSEKSANINAQAAVLQALQGNWESAQKFTQQYVDDATADQKYKVDLLKSFIDQNNTEISRLDTRYQKAISLSYDMAKDEYTNARNAANDKIDNDLKIAQTGKVQGENGKGGQSNFSDVMQAAIDQGATPEQAARAAASVSENSGIQVDQNTLNNWTNQARSLKKTAPATTTAATTTGSSKIDAEIAQLKKSGILTDADIRYSLKKNGYTQDQIDASSLGTSTFGGFLDSVTNYLFK